MNIYFDILLKNPALEKTISPRERDFYKTARDFIQERLSPLKSAIEKEEKAAEVKKLHCFTEIIMGPPPELAFRNYSLPLRERMNNCFSDEDGEYLTLLVYQRLTRA